MNLLKPSVRWSVMSKKMVPSRSSARLADELDASLWRSSSGGSRPGYEGLLEDLGEGISVSSGMSAGNEVRILGGLDDEGELHGRGGHFDGGLGALVERAVDDVGPVDEFGYRSGVEAELWLKRCGRGSWCRRCRRDRRTCAWRRLGSCWQARKLAGLAGVRKAERWWSNHQVMRARRSI
jgi:hypothetical protein